MANTDPTLIKLSDLSSINGDQVFTSVVKSTGVVMECPVGLGFRLDNSDLWTLPLEPLVSVQGGKTIVRRNIAKSVTTGTVKEQWNLDDYKIQVSGMFQGKGVFPESDLAKLQTFLEAGKSVVIHCKLLDVLGIGLMCIDTWDFPETAGLENQKYKFSGYSDKYFSLS